MTLKNKHLLKLIIFSVTIIFSNCSEKDTDFINHCGINGSINVGTSQWSYPNGFIVTLEDVNNESVKHSAVSDAYGLFSFRDIDAGTYYVNAVKEGYRWVWMVDDGKVNHRDHVIELTGNQIKELEILFDNSAHQDGLDITDLNGNHLTRIEVSKNMTTVSFRLFNGTQTSHNWKIDYERCYVATFSEFEYVFTSFNIAGGTLASGDNVVLVGELNPRIFNPQFINIQGELYLNDYSSIGYLFNSIKVCFE